MNMSPLINELITALAKAQGKIQPAIKDKKNPHFKSSYADLSSIWDACRIPLSENGLAVVQTIENKEKEPVLVTTLAHSSGQWMRSEMPIITQKMDPQGIGSALTYYRRYSLASIVGVAPDDDDAEAAQNRNFRKAEEVKPPEYITNQQAAQLCEKLMGCPFEYKEKMAEFCKKNKATAHFLGLPQRLYTSVLNSIENQLAECMANHESTPEAVEA